MKLTILCVGKKHNSKYIDAIADFEKRLPKHIGLSWQYIATSHVSTESTALLASLKPTQTVWLLDESGQQMSSPSFAHKLDSLQNNSVKELVIIIGGSYGVDAKLLERTDAVISFGQMVYPHQLVRLILVEQLYRAVDILSGGKYHHT